MMQSMRGWSPWLGTLVGVALTVGLLRAGHQTVPVPPWLEIEVLDPNVDSRGNPAILTRPSASGTIQIDIPPTVLVHRYYYSGDRTFQGPLLAGGPCILVFSHPSTGQRLYIPVQMLPGAPRVTYTSSAIEYDYGSQGITIGFGMCGNPKVTYRNHETMARKVEDAAGAVRGATRRLIDRTDLPQAREKAAQGTKNVFLTTVDRANDLGKTATTTVIQAVKVLPLAKMFSSTPEDRGQRARDASVQKAETQNLAKPAEQFINTNR